MWYKTTCMEELEASTHKKHNLMRSQRLLVFGLALLNVVALCSAQDVIRTLQWNLTETNYTRNGVNKALLTMNGLYPGPTLNLNYGERIRVNVTNQGEYGVTIHWHGVKQPRNPWSDGPEFVTQCPIQPGSSYTYEIILSDEEGTLWWHAHSDWSRATVHGAIVISPRNGVYPYLVQPDEDIPLILGSWFDRDVMEMLEDALNAANPTLLDADALTINGQTASTNDTELFTMSVESNKTYLLRVICNTMIEEMFLAVANHNLTVVGIDGAYVQNFTSDYIFISPGQAMDILLTTDQQPGKYYLHTRALSSLGSVTTIINALVNYTDQASDFGDALSPSLPTTSNRSAAYDFTAQLRHINSSDYPINVPTPDDLTRIFINVSGNPFNASLNNIKFVSPQMDVLQAYWTGNDTVYTTDFPVNSSEAVSFQNGTRVFEVEYNTTVEIVFQGFSGVLAMNHPMHLHGYSFYVLGSKNNSVFNETTDPVENYNLVDPPLMNTVSLPLQGWAAVRFTADNPGVWFMHCHLEKHSTWGMDTVMIVRNGTADSEKMMAPPLGIIAPC